MLLIILHKGVAENHFIAVVAIIFKILIYWHCFIVFLLYLSVLVRLEVSLIQLTDNFKVRVAYPLAVLVCHTRCQRLSRRVWIPYRRNL